MRATLLSFLALAVPAFAGPIKGPSEVKLEVKELSDELDFSSDADEIKYRFLGSKLKGFRVQADDPKTVRLIVIGYVDETGWIVFSSVKGGKLQDIQTVKVIVGTGGPAPGPGPPPIPPGPIPPVPPGPGPPPPPEPAPPIAGPGFKVLIILEKTLQHKLTSQQVGIVFGDQTKAYIASKDGEFAVLDKDNDASSFPKPWQDAMKRPRTSLPWVLISNGKTGYEGPLPGHEEEWKILLRKYGGQ